MNKVFCALLIFSFAQSGCSPGKEARGIEGTFEGVFKYRNFQVDLSFEIEKDSITPRVYFTSLEQNAYRIPTHSVSVSGDSLRFVLQSDFYTYVFANKFDGRSNTLHGRLSVDSTEFPYVLHRTVAKNKTTFEEVPFESNGNTLSGAVWHPAQSNGLGLFIVTSSGTNGRSSSNAEALHFSQKGFTVFHFDKRGTGKSEGSLEDVTIEALASDDINAIHFFSRKTGLSLPRITILGSSQGGAKVPLICRSLPDLRSGISVSTPGCSLLESDLNFMMNRLENEIASEHLSTAREVQKSVFQYLSGEFSKTELEKLLDDHKSEAFYPHLWIPQLNDEIYHELSYTPIPHFEKLKVPILIIQGMADEVIPKNSYVNIENALIKAGNNHYRILTLEDANHAMTMFNGSDFRYWSMRHPEYFASIEHWIKTVSRDEG